MISTAPSTLASALLEGAPSGLTLTARIMNDGVLVQSIPNGSITYDDGYTATFTAPVTTGQMTLEWLDGATVVGAETLIVTAVPATDVSTSGTTLVRVLVDTTATLTTTFYADGVATDPSPATATITITRDDGTILVNAQPATRTGVGTFGYPLTSVHTSLLDLLAVEWGSSLGTLSATVEVVGGFLFTITQARALSPLNNASTYPTSAIVDARTMVETALEDACGVAFVPRYKREAVSGVGSREVLLSMPRVRAIRSVMLDGATIGVSALATVMPSGPGVIDYPDTWTTGFRNYEVAYEHGYDYPPPMATLAALTWAKSILVKGPIDDRTTAFTTEDGTFSMSTPGVRGAYSGLPVVDAFIGQYNLIAGIA